MERIDWNLRNIANENVIIISKSVFKIGRNTEADLITDHREVSRNHATLSILIDGLLYVTDNKSSNGTFVNDEKIKPMELKQLNHGDVIGFGWHQNMSENLNFQTPPLVFKVVQHLTLPILEISLVSTTKSTNQESCVEEKTGVQEDDCIIISTSEEVGDKGSSRLKDHIEVEDCVIVPCAESSKAITVEEKCSEVFPADIQKEKSQFSKNNLSVIEDCVILSSDDENEPFESSQIFAISKQIKQEQTSLYESVDPYSEVKHELEDLDHLPAYHVVVDVTDELDHFESTTDLLNILENSQEMEESVNVSELNTKKQNQRSECSETIEKSEGVPEESKKNKKGQQKNVVPIIPAHFYRKSRCRGEMQKKSPDKIATKRKSVSKLEVPEIKKLKKDSNTKKSLAEERKKRLRELTVKTNPALKETSKNKTAKATVELKTADTTRIENSTATVEIMMADTSRKESTNAKVMKRTAATSRKVITRGAVEIHTADTSKKENTTVAAKISDSRGKFLLHEIDVPPILSRGARDPRFRYKTNAPADKETIIASKTSQNSIQDTTVSSNLSPSSDDAAMPWRDPSNAPKSSGTHPDSTAMEDRSGLIWKLGAYRQAAKLPHVSRTIDDLNEDISAVVCWSVKWLLEQGGMDVSPPVNGNRPLMKVPLYFRGFAEYEALMNPLIKLELWQFVYQTTFNKDDERTPIKARIVHERKVHPVCCLDCELFLSDAENRANPFRPEDLSLIEIKIKDSSNWYRYTSYGYLKSVQRSTTRDGHHVKITIVTKHFTEELFGTRIFIKVIANIGSYLRLIRTIKFLEFSPICKYVLKPDNIEPIKSSSKLITNLMPINLNRLQHEIVADACQVCLKDGPGMYLIKGPPGTGKSTVIVGIIMETLLNNHWGDQPPLILLTAPSNAAVDGLILKLNDARSKLPDAIRRQLKIVRIGPDSSISQHVNKFKLDVLARNNIISCKGLSSLLAYKESVDKGEESDVFLRRHLGQDYLYEMRAAEDTLLMKSNVICTTLNSCVSHRIMHATRRNQLKFTCCIVDEATQCNELESLLPIQLRIQRFVLVGDPKQLPAVVCNKDAYRLGFGQSLFYRIQDNFKNKTLSPVKMLCEQYRMKPEICEYPNKTFYEGRLRSLPKCSNPIEPALKPYLVFNLTRVNEDRSDYINTDEVCLIWKLLETLLACVNPSCAYSIGIITPYRAQKDLISQHICKLRVNMNVSITVNTVDSFQGMENDVIIISSVRNKNNNFLQNEQRLNVALTRAKQALYVIGNYSLFKHCKPLYELREDAKKRKLLLDIKDDPRNIPNLGKFILRDAAPYFTMNTG